MSHNVETMAYTNDTPWHGLGHRVDNKQTVPQMLKAAKIDWTVDKKPLFVKDASLNEHEVPDRYALVRSSDHRVLDICGNAYTPHQNHENFKFFKEYVEAGDAYMETAGSLRNGELCWGLANLNASFKLKGTDEVKGYLLVIAPHVVGKSSIAKLTTVRVVCNNTLDLAMRDTALGTFRMPHRSAMTDEIIQKAKEHLGIARETLMEFSNTATSLQKMKLSHDETIRLLAQVYQPDIPVETLINEPAELNKKMNLLLDINQRAPGAEPKNAWGLLNAVTYYADHVASRTVDKRLANSWLGKTGAQKQRILQLLLGKKK